jgi:hypothetical protein
MPRPKKKSKTQKRTPKKKIVRRKRIALKRNSAASESSGPGLPNLNQDAPKLIFKISGTPILPGSKI